MIIKQGTQMILSKALTRDHTISAACKRLKEKKVKQQQKQKKKEEKKRKIINYMIYKSFRVLDYKQIINALSCSFNKFI